MDQEIGEHNFSWILWRFYLCFSDVPFGCCTWECFQDWHVHQNLYLIIKMSSPLIYLIKNDVCNHWNVQHVIYVICFTCNNNNNMITTYSVVNCLGHFTVTLSAKMSITNQMISWHWLSPWSVCIRFLLVAFIILGPHF